MGQVLSFPGAQPKIVFAESENTRSQNTSSRIAEIRNAGSRGCEVAPLGFPARMSERRRALQLEIARRHLERAQAIVRQVIRDNDASKVPGSKIFEGEELACAGSEIVLEWLVQDCIDIIDQSLD